MTGTEMDKATASVLVIEDDDATAEELCRVLGSAGFTAERAATLGDGVARATASAYQLVILDRMLPGGDGLDIIDKLRSGGRRTGVLVLSALGRTVNRVEGLDRGERGEPLGELRQPQIPAVRCLRHRRSLLRSRGSGPRSAP